MIIKNGFVKCLISPPFEFKWGTNIGWISEHEVKAKQLVAGRNIYLTDPIAFFKGPSWNEEKEMLEVTCNQIFFENGFSTE
ncbi:hypothetical protein C4569_03925 [Candidatus Parcubacteria bacterium]|nr:MAG: hypothetical protein C4569_03925 [Candidatus Parcubacteria bacterium]